MNTYMGRGKSLKQWNMGTQKHDYIVRAYL